MVACDGRLPGGVMGGASLEGGERGERKIVANAEGGRGRKEKRVRKWTRVKMMVWESGVCDKC